MIKVAIFGVGLIGGSLALCFKNDPNIHVIGYSNRQSSIEKYLQRGVVHSATTSLKEAAEQADFIFLCVPVGLLEEYMIELSKCELKSGCIITDVGSTKAAVAKRANQLAFADAYFIGGHPMAGSERSGVEAASSHLYENAYYILTPDKQTPALVVERLKQLLTLTKANIVVMDADEHDEVVGAISHLPHMIAVALVNQIRQYNENNELYEMLAAGGFRDITRIASSDPIVWRDILLHNKEVVLRLLHDWSKQMTDFASILQNDDGKAIIAAFEQAGQFRSKMPERRKGIIQSIYDCYVDVPDHPGIIGNIAGELGKQRINLSNIQIIESREDIPGVLRLSFHDQLSLDQAMEHLQSIGYAVHM
ncbi:prephenate dehydrogenase [Paenibacillus yanchengensis]|uniref:Prephenate dehydrogenase n=1 Tax=Paenibacillus yanchengensis TaxID=2035833 RepID=A0ABW4YKC6_9BACL